MPEFAPRLELQRGHEFDQTARGEVFAVPHTPRHILQTLAADAHPDVANQAQGGLEDGR